MRTQVFDHVLEMPIAFFTRTQTGKLVSRLNSDVIGAQQAFTSTLSTVLSNIVSLVLVLVAMLVLSWQLTLAALIMLPIFLVPARIVGNKLAGLTREQMQLNGEMSATMTERFNVSGALLVKLFGRPSEEHTRFADRAGAVRDISVRIAMNGRFFITSLGLVAALATALVYGVGGVLSDRRAADRGHADRPGRPAGPALRSADLTDQPADRRDERPGQLRPRVRGARPDADDRRPARGARRRDDPSVTFEHVSFTYPTAADVSLASLESVATRDSRPDGAVLHEVSFHVPAGSTVALVGRSGAGKTTLTHLVARLYEVTGGAVRIGPDDVRDLEGESLHRAVGYVTQDAHMFHDTIRANLALRAAGGHRRRHAHRARGGPHRRPDRLAARRAGHRRGGAGLSALRR